MKKIAIVTINLYQLFASPFLKLLLGSGKFCRFDETCSVFTKRAITQKGLLRGSLLGISRILKCQPFYAFK